MIEIEHPRVFISYSWTDQDHIDWVIALAERLVGDGIDTVLDIWDLKEGHDKYAFMERMVTDPTVHKVLAICDQMYAEKADGRRGGVGTETQIISKSVYESVTQEKFVPIVRERNPNREPYLPVFFQNRKYVDFSDDESFEPSYDQLTRTIYNKPERKKPPLGKPPVHLLQEDAPFVKTAGKLNRLKDAVLRGKPHGQAILQDYFDTFIEALEDFRIQEPLPNQPLDEAVYQSIKEFRPYKETFLELIFFITGHLDVPESYERLVSFLEQLIPFQYRPVAMSSWSENWFDNYRFIATEIFLTLIAALIRSKKYDIAARFMDRQYTYPNMLNGNDWVRGDTSAFNEQVRTLDRMRPERLNLNRISIASDLLGERAHPRLPLRDLVQADLILMIRPGFPFREKVGHWQHCSPLWEIRSGSLELFARSASPKEIEPLKTLFNVKSLGEFLALLNDFFSGQPHLAQFAFRTRVNWYRLLNWNELLEVANREA